MKKATQKNSQEQSQEQAIKMLQEAMQILQEAMTVFVNGFVTADEPSKEWLTVQEAAKYMKLCPATIGSICRKLEEVGSTEVSNIGKASQKCYRITRFGLENYQILCKVEEVEVSKNFNPRKGKNKKVVVGQAKSDG